MILIYYENKCTESIIGILINNFRYFFKNYEKSIQQIGIVVINGVLQKDQAKARPVCNNKKSDEQHNHKRYGSFVKFCDWFIKTVAGDKQVHSYRRCKITYLHIRQKNDPQVNRIYAIAYSYWKNKWHHNDKC